MSLFNKKKEGPEIPPAPRFVDTDYGNGLPSIPSIDALAGIEEKNVVDIPSLEENKIITQELPKSENSSVKNSGDIGANSPSQFQESIVPNNVAKAQNGIPTPPTKQSLPELPKYSKKDDPMMRTVASELSHSETNLPEPPQAKPAEQEMMASMGSEEIMPTENLNQAVKKDVNETIFVRIDKFNSAKKDLSEMQKDLQRIQEIIMDINEIKLKEDEEIEGLNKNIEEIKNRLDKMDVEIFNRI